MGLMLCKNAHRKNRLVTSTNGKRYLLALLIEILFFYYQNLTYKADNINKTITVMRIWTGCSLNIVLSNTKAFGFSFGPARLITIITSIAITNEIPITIRNGIS